MSSQPDALQACGAPCAFTRGVHCEVGSCRRRSGRIRALACHDPQIL